MFFFNILKKILLIFCVSSLTYSITNWYSISVFESKKIFYKNVIESKYSEKLSNLWIAQLLILKNKTRKLEVNINTNIEKSDKNKLIQLSILSLFNDIIERNIVEFQYIQKISNTYSKEEVITDVQYKLFKKHPLVKYGSEIEILLEKFNILNTWINPSFKNWNLFIDFKFPKQLKDDFNNTYFLYIKELEKEVKLLKKYGVNNWNSECIKKANNYSENLIGVHLKEQHL